MNVPKFDYNSLRIFAISAQKGSFTSAAKHLGIPLPTVSRKMLELERDLKTQLFDRSTRGCALTEAGARLFEKVGPGVEILSDVENIGALDNSRLSGRLRLSLPQSFGPWWELLGEFQRINPEIQLSIYSTERRVDLLSDGVDVALRVGAISDDSVIARHLCDFRFILVASPELASRAQRFTAPADVLALPCATWGNAMNDQPVWKLGTSVVKISPRLVVNDYLQLRDRALAGDFITELPSFLAARDISEGRLVEILPDHPLPHSSLHLVYRKLRYPSPIIRSYIDFCTDNFSRYFENWNRLPFSNSEMR